MIKRRSLLVEIEEKGSRSNDYINNLLTGEEEEEEEVVEGEEEEEEIYLSEIENNVECIIVNENIPSVVPTLLTVGEEGEEEYFSINDGIIY